MKQKYKSIRRMIMLVAMVVLCCACAAKEEKGIEISSKTVHKGEGASNVSGEAAAAKEDSHIEEETSDSGGEVVVYVCGAVNSPGVYTLSGKVRMSDAVMAAGGTTPEADMDVLNLAQFISDGQMIRIPAIGEESKQGDVPGTSADAGSSTTSGRVNINTATATELMTIPGIGQAKAQAIMDYREKQGKFGKVEDIMQIGGIKEASFAKMEPYICVE